MVAVILGLIDETSEATSVNLEQITGLPDTYNQDLACIPGSTGWPLLSSLPLPMYKQLH